MTLDEIIRKIKLNKSDEPILIAIEGFGGSGKTTFANKLKDALGETFVINIDDFIIKENLVESSWDKEAFDRGRLEQQVLIPITSSRQASYQKLKWETNSLSNPVVIPDVRYIIVEGISSYHPNLAKYYDYKIWIDTPIEIAKQRGQARDGSNENVQYWDLWAENDLRYQQKYHPEIEADFVIKN